MARKKLLSYPDYLYNPSSLRRNLTEKEIRQEYTRLRSIAQKRLRRLQKAGDEYELYYKNWMTSFQTIKELGGKTNIIFALSRAGRFLQGPTTIKEAKADIKKRLSELSSHGFHRLTGSDLSDFYKFMNTIEDDIFKDVYIASDKVIEYYENMRQAGESRDEIISQFREWKENNSPMYESFLEDRPNFVTEEDFRTGRFR